MYFDPVYLKDIFTPEQEAELREVVEEYHRPDKKFYFDDISDREVRRSKKLEKFNELLVPLAKKVFGDDTLKATYGLILSYSKDSHLVGHHDTNANIYTINYAVRSNVVWPIWFGNDDGRFALDIPEGQALAFMGCDDFHYREKTDQEDADLVMVMFHFCPEDHWYFTKGPEHFKHIQDHFEIVGTVRKEKEDLEWILDNESKDFDPQKLQQHEMMLDHKKQTLEILLSQHDRITGMKGIDE
jgi:hypothetical protein